LGEFVFFLKEMGDGTDIRAMEDAEGPDCSKVLFKLMKETIQEAMKELRGWHAPLGDFECMHAKRDG
jgi:7-cyano-7-deazaguanine synthase in queuosine biosynthesis